MTLPPDTGKHEAVTREGAAPAAANIDPAKLDGYLRLYDRQMSHAEKTQGIEWKVSIGVWTLLAAAVAWASTNPSTARAIHGCGWTTAIALAVIAHALWLWLVHASEDEDKKLWCRYRAEAEAILGAPAVPLYTGRRKARAAVWLVAEVGVTIAMALVLWLLVTSAPPSIS